MSAAADWEEIAVATAAALRGQRLTDLIQFAEPGDKVAVAARESLAHEWSKIILELVLDNCCLGALVSDDTHSSN